MLCPHACRRPLNAPSSAVVVAGSEGAGSFTWIRLPERAGAPIAFPDSMRCRCFIARTAAILALILLAVVLLVYFCFVLPFWGIPFNGSRHGRVPITPPWALECWLWEDDVNTAAYVTELLDGYAKHDIPVRTILIDSAWSLRYNDFKVDEERYPKPAEFFKNLQDRGYRVVLWMTCMVDSRSKDTPIQDSADWFNDARSRGYLAGGGHQVNWWKGRGGFIDYSSPEAMKWWRGMQQQVFDWGLDGWKLDGVDTFFSSTVFGKIPFPYQKTSKGWMTTREYMDHYARDEYQHGLVQNPEFITLIRALDGPYAHPEGFGPFDAAPVTWIGDRTHTWETSEPVVEGQAADKDLMMKASANRGFEAALRDILLSSKKGYCVVGDDVAGYHGSRQIPPRLYIRWAEFAALTGLFLNGGHGERALWKRSPQELEIIRKFSWLHTELVPYMFSHVVACHEGRPSLIRPTKGKYHYLFGDDFLVAPIYRDSLTNTVTLPPGRWRYLFDDREIIAGPKQLTRAFPLDEFPVFVRDGAIIPMNVSRSYTGFGDTNSEGFVTFSIYPNGTSRFTLQQTDRSGSTGIKVVASSNIEIAITGIHKPHILRVLLESKPVSVALDGKTLSETGEWRYDQKDRRLWIKTSSYEGGKYLITR
jgi:alpha-glucosidase (family GH31 glycosyl hydrolase)